MRFGDRVRELRKRKELGQRALAERIGVSFTYVSKIENHRLDFGDYPSEALIHKLADVLEVDEDELLLLAERVPTLIRQRIMQRPEVFVKFAQLNDNALDWLVAQLKRLPVKLR